VTLHALVAAFGGDLYSGGLRASVPAPGHSAADRSISLLISDGRLVIHGFGGVDWRAMRDELRRRGFIDADGRLAGGGAAAGWATPPDPRTRSAVAALLWDGVMPLGRGDPAATHLTRRGVRCGLEARNLGRHPGAPVSVYRPGGRTRTALIARISDGDDVLTGVELTYLEPSGRAATGLRLVRKTVGRVPPGAAVRLAPAAPVMLVGEGVITTLSAMDRFGLPGWALMSAGNLAAWPPPSWVRRVLIAADRGAVGEAAADRLRRRLEAAGVSVAVRLPKRPCGDWNEAAPGQRREEGRRRAPERRG
jgi:putative DNA primase/helicase